MQIRPAALADIDGLYQLELARGQGVGRALVVAAEKAAWAEERAYLRLEIRRDNAASQALFEAVGYRRFGVLSDYYADHMEVLRYERRLSPDRKPMLRRIPFYEQTLDFTCGPSSLMMAMQALRPEIELTRSLPLGACHERWLACSRCARCDR